MKKVVSLVLILALIVSFMPVLAANDVNYQMFKSDGIEGYETGSKFKVKSHPAFCEFGTPAASTVASEEMAHSGIKSIKQSGRYGSNLSLKALNLFGRELTTDDVGKVFRISFYVYPLKSAGVYKEGVGSLTAEERAEKAYTEEELKDSIGTKITVRSAGPDGNSYMYRTGAKDDVDYFVYWDKWNLINFYYKVTADTLPTGSEDAKSDPYINAIRINQDNIDYSINQGLTDTFYFDDFKVNEVGAQFKSGFEGDRVTVVTHFFDECKVDNARTCIIEYDKDGKLCGATVGSSNPTKDDDGTFNATSEEYMRKQSDSRIYAVSYASNFTKPITPMVEIQEQPVENSEVSVFKAKNQAEKMLELSQADYTDALDYSERLNKDNQYFHATEDAYTRARTPDEVRNTSDMAIKSDMFTFIKFDISSATYSSVSDAYLSLYTHSLTTPGAVTVYECPSDWSETTITYNNMPEAGDALSTMTVDGKSVVYMFDVAPYVNKALRNGDDNISFCLKGTGHCTVASRSMNQASFKPELIFEGIGMAEGSKAVSSFDYSNYIDVMKRKSGIEGDFFRTPTRIMSSIKDYTPVTQAPKLNKYGSWIDGGKYEATGFFRTELIDGRWWIIDPDGYKQMHIAVSRVEPDRKNEAQAAGFDEKYGSIDGWVEKLNDDLIPYGFNGIGPWSDYQYTLNAKTVDPMVVAGYNGSFILGYDKNSKVDNMLSVFDPEFETHADNVATTWIKPYADNPFVLGWITDNEPIANNDMLETYLTCNPFKDRNIYNYYAAWAWLKDRYSEDASLEDITAKDEMDWVEYVYDRYMYVCVNAIRKYDKNHMIIGPKLDKNHQGSFRALKKWVDIVGYDYYGNAWTADIPQVEQWYLWAGKPMINTEWYVKGDDARGINDLTNESGVGWTATTQAERGYYYQSFVLSMLESDVFVGWQWFRYTDNLGGASDGSYSPDKNANKGIYTRDYKPWTEILSIMKELNINVYSLTQYFDK
ncbi:MAG: DNRLRE domain-containing protein [Ruminococcaceae bacterium]|nr:DNRLRE domain-containing protein [Oscillospiraceae bacterium]